MRKTNNEIKRDFLQKWVPKGSKVLDAGCGQGGDIHKWNSLDVDYTGFDPNRVAITEARRRAGRLDMKTRFIVGTIRDAPNEKFDVICYNFSFQYQDPDEYPEIVGRLKSGGILIGIVPDPGRFIEAEKNGIQLFEGSVPGKVGVYISGTPYYEAGPIEEPVVTCDDVSARLGLELIEWGDSFSIYSKFVFRSQ